MIRTSADLLAEAKKAEQDDRVVEPFQLKLNNGHVVTFRDPRNIPTEEVDAATSLSERLRIMCANRTDFRALWREWGKVEQRYINGLIDAVIDYYDQAGKDESSSSS